MPDSAARYASMLLVISAAPLAAVQTAVPNQHQTSAAVTAAATSIGVADLARHLKIITADSLQARATPSRGLEATARYIAGQFKQLGLLPNGDQTRQLDTIGPSTQFRMVTVVGPDGRPYQTNGMDTSFIQRYPLLGNMTANPDGSRINFTVMLRKQGKPIIDANERWPTEVAKHASVSFATAAFFAADSVPQSGGRGDWASYAPPEAFIVAGPHTAQTVQAAQLQEKLVLYVPHAHADVATRRQIIDLLRTSNHVVILSAEDSAAFAARRRAATARPVLLVDKYMEDALGVRHWAVDMQGDALQKLLAVAGVDLAAARVATAPTVRVVPSMVAMLHAQAGGFVDSASGPNVIATLPGSDTTVRKEYIVYSARMDHASGVDAGADSAAGAAGLLALAKAFSQPGARPRRSILFVALSGGAPDFAGTTYFVANPPFRVAASGLTINIRLGPLGRYAPDSVTIDGIRDLELASRPDWLASRHPELQLAVADGGTILTDDADRLPFIRRALPSVYFYNRAGKAGAPTSVDLEHAARALRLAFYFGQDLANATQRTTWTAAGRRDRGRFLGR